MSSQSMGFFFSFTGRPDSTRLALDPFAVVEHRYVRKQTKNVLV
jgi:hypothetical protein